MARDLVDGHPCEQSAHLLHSILTKLRHPSGQHQLVRLRGAATLQDRGWQRRRSVNREPASPAPPQTVTASVRLSTLSLENARRR
jgi:hypothetical protein